MIARLPTSFRMDKQESVFICGAHKSGTTLLRSLLDGHPELLALPFESHFFRTFGHWVDNDYKFHWPQVKDPRIHKEALIRMLEKRNAGSRQFSDTAFISTVSIDRFEKLWNESSVETIADRWELFSRFIRSELGADQRMIVEKSVKNAEMANLIAAEIPNAKFIHITRNPYANLVAIREFRRKNYSYPLLPRAIRTLYNNFYFGYRNQFTLKDRLLLISFEELLESPVKTMKKVAQFMGIEYQDSLVIPTSQNKAWKGNSTSEANFKGIDTSPLSNYKSLLSGIEIEYVNRALSEVLPLFNYAKMKKVALNGERGKTKVSCDMPTIGCT